MSTLCNHILMSAWMSTSDQVRCHLQRRRLLKLDTKITTTGLPRLCPRELAVTCWETPICRHRAMSTMRALWPPFSLWKEGQRLEWLGIEIAFEKEKWTGLAYIEYRIKKLNKRWLSDFSTCLGGNASIFSLTSFVSASSAKNRQQKWHTSGTHQGTVWYTKKSLKLLVSEWLSYWHTALFVSLKQTKTVPTCASSF